MIKEIFILLLKGLLAIVLVVTLPFIFLEAEEWLWTRPQAYKIIHTLDQYKDDNGVYPEKLIQLVPEYLRKIPSTKLFRKNDFYYEQGGDYFRAEGGNPLTYTLDYSTYKLFNTPRYFSSKRRWGWAPFKN